VSDGDQREQRGLSRERILNVALSIVDEGGLGALSMRAVASRLSVTPMALYFHFKNKAELLDALVQRVVADIRLPDHPDVSWEELMLAFGTSGRQVMRAHPGIAAAIIGENPSGVGEPGLRLGERIYAAMHAAGFTDADMAVGFYTVMVFTLGFVAMEVPRHAVPITEFERDPVMDRMEEFFASLPVAEYPQHVRMAPQLARISTADQFDAGLHMIVSGLQARTARNDGEPHPDTARTAEQRSTPVGDDES
jgi:TetR/AcrR family transcriptional regulator, tetracycline repressor protein